MEQVIFYFFSALLIGAGTMVITVKNPVHAALSLVLAFFSSAGLWLRRTHANPRPKRRQSPHN